MNNQQPKLPRPSDQTVVSQPPKVTGGAGACGIGANMYHDDKSLIAKSLGQSPAHPGTDRLADAIARYPGPLMVVTNTSNRPLEIEFVDITNAGTTLSRADHGVLCMCSQCCPSPKIDPESLVKGEPCPVCGKAMVEESEPSSDLGGNRRRGYDVCVVCPDGCVTGTVRHEMPEEPERFDEFTGPMED